MNEGQETPMTPQRLHVEIGRADLWDSWVQAAGGEVRPLEVSGRRRDPEGEAGVMVHCSVEVAWAICSKVQY